MTKQYLRKNINMFLIVVIIISVGSLIAMSTYYSQRYQVISEGYSELEGIYKNTSQELIAKSNELLLLRGTLNETSTDVKKYDELYSGKVAELDKTSKDLQISQANYNKAKVDLESSLKNLKTEQDKSVKLQTDLSKSNTELTTCKNSLSSAQHDLNDCEDVCPGYEDGTC